MYEMSELQAEAFFFHLVIALWIELIEESDLFVWHWQCLIELSQNTKLQHFIAKVTSVELYAKDGFVQVLELGHGELLRQQLKANRLEVNLTTKLISSLS